MDIDKAIESAVVTTASKEEAPAALKNGNRKLEKTRKPVEVKKFWAIRFVEEVTGRTIEEMIKEAKDETKKKIFESFGEWVSDRVDDFFLGNGKKKRPANYSYGNTVVRSVDNPSYLQGKNAKMQAKKSSKWDFSILTWDDKDYVKSLLQSLRQVIEEDGYLTVAQLYDAIDDPSHLDGQDHKWGWTDLNPRIAYVKNYYGAWRLYLPEPEELNNN